MAARNKLKYIFIFTLNILATVINYFMRDMVKFSESLLLKTSSTVIWFNYAGQKANLAFFGSFLLTQIIFSLIFFKFFYKDNKICFLINLFICVVGFGFAIDGGLGWEFIFPGTVSAGPENPYPDDVP